MTGIFEEPEGATPLDPDEMEGLRFDHVETRDELNELEQANITTGLRWLTRNSRKDVLSEELLRELHKRMFGDVWDWAGIYRQTEKNIGIDPIQISTQLRNLLGDAKYWAQNNTYPSLEAAARYHHRLVQIHLFANGNGRHARIATDEYLRQYFKHEPIDWAAGQDLMISNERRDQYIAALRAADGHDMTAMIEFVRAQPN